MGWGTWAAWLVKHVSLGFGPFHDLMAVRSSLAMGSTMGPSQAPHSVRKSRLGILSLFPALLFYSSPPNKYINLFKKHT